MPDGITFEWNDPNALLVQVRKMLDAQANRIRQVPERAIQRGTFELLKLVQAKAPKKTSTLVRSIHAAVRKLSADLIEGRVGTWLEYARYLEEGTGLYGPAKRAIEIVPKSKKALFWGGYDENGGPLVRKKVVVKGITPRGYFAAAVAEFLPRYVQIIQEELAKESAA
jgi:hypothetical protein